MSGIRGEGRIVDYGNSTLLKQTLIERHAPTLQILEIKQYANLKIKAQLKLKSLLLEEVDSFTLNNVLNNCKDTLVSLEINGNDPIADIYLPNLKHVRIVNCNIPAAFYERHSDNLVTLDLDFLEENPRKCYPKLKFLTLINNLSMLDCCTSSIDYLDVYDCNDDDINSMPECIKRLKDLNLFGISETSILLLLENRLSLEFLYINETFGFYLDVLNMDFDFPKLQTVLLPDCKNHKLLQFFTRNCPKGVQIITTTDELADNIMIKRARSNYPYPRISREVRYWTDK